MTEYTGGNAIIEFYKLKQKVNLTDQEKEALKERKFFKSNPELFKRCNCCNTIKYISEFYKNPLKSQGVFDYCKECAKNQAKKRREYDKIDQKRERSIKNAMPA